MPKRQHTHLAPVGRLIALDNRPDVDPYPHGIEADLGIPGYSDVEPTNDPVVFEHHIGTSRGRRKHHNLYRGTETRSHRYRGADSYTGDVPMTRLGGKVMGGFSMMEQDAYLTIDFKVENLLDAVAQPQRVPIVVGGKQRWWHPDALLKLRDEPPAFVEVKTIAALHPRTPSPGASKEEVERIERRNRRVAITRIRIAAIRAAINSMGAQFWLLTEHQIRIQPQLHNADVMWCGMTANIPEEWIAEAVVALRRMPPVATVADLSACLPEFADSIIMLACVLDRRGYLRLDREAFFRHDCRFENRTWIG